MNTVNKETLDQWTARLKAVRPDATPQWGKLTPIRMMAHLRRTFEYALGEQPMEPIKMNLVMKFLVKKLYFDGPLNFPKGKVTAPPAFTPEPEDDFDAERDRVIEYTRKFAERLEQDPDHKEVNAIFGPQPLSWWSRLHAKHMDHHLRQFNA